jgi:hypothetical protein
MIGWIDQGVFLGAVMDYHYKKIDEGEAKLLSTNIYSEEKNAQKNFFLNNFDLHTNTRTKNFFIHASLSFNPEEKVSEETMQKIGEEWLHRMEYRDVPYTMFVHNDKAHQHIHIVASRVRFDGDLTCKSKLYKKENKEVCTQLRSKYHLMPVPEINGKVEKLKEIRIVQYQVSNAILKAIRNDVAINNLPDIDSKKQPTDENLLNLLGKEQFNKLKFELDKKGMITYSKKQILSSKLKRIYAISDTKDQFLVNCDREGVYVRALIKKNTPRFDYGLKGMSFYVSEKALEDKYHLQSIEHISETKKKNVLTIKQIEQRSYLKSSVTKVLKSATNIHEFTLNLKRYGVEVQYSYSKRNGQEIIQGANFKTQNSDWFKGSDIHRDLSWNNIKNQFQTGIASTNEVEKPTFTQNEIQNSDNLPENNNPSTGNTLERLLDSSGTDKTSEEKELDKQRRRNRDQER